MKKVSDQERATISLAAERHTLEMLAGGASLKGVLQDLCDTIDAQAPEIISTILLMDQDGERLWPTAGRRVPVGWTETITPLPIGPQMVASGTAAFLKQPVVTSDIANDPRWRVVEGTDYKNLALSYGLRAAWSYPLISRDDEVLGTFAIYYPEPKSPDDSDLELIESAANIAVIAIESDRSRAALERAFEGAKNSEAKLRQVIDTIPTLAWCNLPDGPNEFLNKRWHDYTGLSPEESHGWGWQAAFHPEDLPPLIERWRKMLASGEPDVIEARLRRHDGVFRWFLIRAEPLRDETGNIIRWYGTSTDIEERKQAEEKIRQDERELRQLIDYLPQHVIVLDPAGRHLEANQMVLDYGGFTLEDFRADDFQTRAFHPDDIEREEGERRPGLASGAPFEIERRSLGKDGQYRWFLFRYKPLLDQEGRITRWLATATDIQERKQAEEGMRKENITLREEILRTSMFEEIVGASPALQSVLDRVAKVAPTGSTVLITGETGTGKELIARAIHKRSKRSTRAFVSVNCAAIPSSLIPSELFGHEKGAFTGAVQRRLGRFELAEGGTIFLDEIGELPAETQVALLRVLQEHEFERVGGNRSIKADVRLIVATNRDLQAAMAATTFRSDLFYRLNVFPIEMPPLRERREDIPLLVEYFIDRYASKAGKKMRSINQKTLDLLIQYAWPGNIRELQNVIERSVIICESEDFTVDKSWLSQKSVRGERASLKMSATQEKEMIEAALAETGGRVSGPSGAATKLGIPPSTLDSKIKSLKINKYLFKTP